MAYFLMIAINLILGGQPYSLTVTTLTPRLEALCRMDENCIDIEEIEAGCGTDLECCQRFNDCDTL